MAGLLDLDYYQSIINCFFAPRLICLPGLGKPFICYFCADRRKKRTQTVVYNSHSYLLHNSLSFRFLFSRGLRADLPLNISNKKQTQTCLDFCCWIKTAVDLLLCVGNTGMRYRLTQGHNVKKTKQKNPTVEEMLCNKNDTEFQLHFSKIFTVKTLFSKTYKSFILPSSNCVGQHCNNYCYYMGTLMKII